MDRRNAEHLRRAGADEILPANDLTGCLLARATLHPGIIDALTELSTTSEPGSKMYIMDAPADLVGLPFDVAAQQLRQSRQAILIGVRSHGRVSLCPPGDWLIDQPHQLVVLGLDDPPTNASQR